MQQCWIYQDVDNNHSKPLILYICCIQLTEQRGTGKTSGSSGKTSGSSRKTVRAKTRVKVGENSYFSRAASVVVIKIKALAQIS